MKIGSSVVAVFRSKACFCKPLFFLYFVSPEWAVQKKSQSIQREFTSMVNKTSGQRTCPYKKFPSPFYSLEQVWKLKLKLRSRLWLMSNIFKMLTDKKLLVFIEREYCKSDWSTITFPKWLRKCFFHWKKRLIITKHSWKNTLRLTNPQLLLLFSSHTLQTSEIC